jgi:1-acyl-sn-glycerol-3-phosphate acyltransferase
VLSVLLLKKLNCGKVDAFLVVNMFQNKINPIYRFVNKRFSIQTSGIEKINPDQNYIFAMNHQSVMDIPIAYAILTPSTNIKINLFLNRIFYNIFFPLTVPLDAISINMNKGKNARVRNFNRAQLNVGVLKLRQGNSVLIYPEGGMDGARTSQIARGETGPVRLAIRTGTPILPIGINGTNHAYPFTVYTNNPFRHRREIPIEVTIGDEICYKRFSNLNLEHYSKANQSTLRGLTEELMVMLSRLSGLPHMGSV